MDKHQNYQLKRSRMRVTGLVGAAMLYGIHGAVTAQSLPGPADVDSNLQAHYCFETSLVADCTGNGSNGIAFGNVLPSTGRIGNGASFGGFDAIGYIRVPNTSRLALTADFTIAYWAKLTSFHGIDGNNQRREYGIQIPLAKSHDRSGMFTEVSSLASPQQSGSTSTDLDVAAIFRTTGAGVVIDYRLPHYTLGDWVHIAYTFNSPSRTISEYVNGVLRAQLQLPAGVSFTQLASDDLYLGAQAPLFGSNVFQYPFAGVLDEVRIYNRELQGPAVRVLADTADRTPDAFAFAAPVDVEPGTLRVSNEITLTGFEAPVSIKVVGGEYGINGGGFTAVDGTVNPGDRLVVRHVATTAFSAATVTGLDVGGVSGEFRSTTRAADTQPDAFSFAAQFDVDRDSLRTSGEIVVSGVEVPVPVAVTGGSYSINGSAFISTPAQVFNADRIRVRHVAASTFSTMVTTVLTIGSGQGEFSSRTLAADTTPNAFHFEDKVLRTPLLPRHISNPITVSGINTSSPISVSGGPEAEYSVNGKPFTALPGLVEAGDRVRLRNRIPLNDLRPKVFSVDATLTIGGVQDTWTISLLP